MKVSFGRFVDTRDLLSFFRSLSPKKARKQYQRPYLVRPFLETLEDRTLLSVIPAPIVTSHPDISNLFGNESSPSVAVNPNNPLQAVTVYTTNQVSGGVQTIGIGGKYSTDGGATWNAFVLPGNISDPSRPVANPGNFSQATDASVSFDRNNHFYVVSSQHTADNTSGAIVLDSYNFGVGSPSQLLSNNVVYEWLNQDAAVAPRLAVDQSYIDPSTQSKVFTDSTTNATQTDPYAGNVYIAWATNNNAPKGSTYFNPNTIEMVSSADGGNNFTNPVSVGDGSYGGQRDATPQLVVSQGTPDSTTSSPSRVQAGQVNVIWDDFGSGSQAQIPFDIIKTSQVTGGGSAAVFTDTTSTPIVDNGPTVSAQNVSASQFVNFPPNATLDNLDVTLVFVHPDLSELSVTLTDPNNNTITLFAVGQVKGADMGTVNGNNLGTVFDDSASRSITDANATSPFIGHFRPTGSLSSLVRGKTIASITGVWKLQINDTKLDTTPTQNLVSWSLNFTSGLRVSGAPTQVATTYVRGALSGPYSSIPNSVTAQGVGPGIGIASDNTLGSFSPYQGRLYVTYVDDTLDSGNNKTPDTNIFLKTSDDGGKTWFNPVQITKDHPFTKVNDDNPTVDGFSAGNRTQLQPSVAVDQNTGTLVITYYDARDDASNARVGTYAALSIDGGQSYGPQTFLNTPNAPYDTITQKSITLGPISDNQSAGYGFTDGTFGLGTHQGVAAAQGHLYAVWAGNLNGGSDGQQLLDILTAHATYAAGPRIVSSTMGTVAATVVDSQTFNNTFTLDGTPELKSFAVTFDTPVDPSTFDASDVTVQYQDPNTHATSQVPVSTVTALDGNTLFGPAQVGGNNKLATTYLITLQNPQTKVGTYSYTVGPNINDAIRSVGVNTTIVPGSTTSYPSTQVPKQVGPGNSANTYYTTSTINISGVPNNQVVTDVKVHVDISYPQDSDLYFFLVGPDGQSYSYLSIFEGGTGQGFTGTIFDDKAPNPISSGTAPFTGSFRPETPLSRFNGLNPNGTWILYVYDLQNNPNTGTLNSWSMDIQTGTVVATVIPGNLMDQNGNAKTGEAISDTYSAPKSINNNGSAPYDATTLPLVIPGPHIFQTFVPGNGSPNITSLTGDGTNLVLNSTVSALDITFDRDMDPTKVSASEILRIMGPAGLITGTASNPITITADPSADPSHNPDPQHPRTYRITFPTQNLSGTYTITFGPGIKSIAGDGLDTNQNAGVDLLFQRATSFAPLTFTNNSSTTIGNATTPNSTAVSSIQVPQDFVLQNGEAPVVTLDISYANDSDLEAILIGPDGTQVILFKNLKGSSSSNQTANFSNTILDDRAKNSAGNPNPITLGTPSYSGRYNPQEPLSIFADGTYSTRGKWTLQIIDSKSGTLGTLNNWSLTFQKPLPDSGLGEPVADQATASFRIFTETPTTAQSFNTFTAVGPASITTTGGGESGVNTGPSSRGGSGRISALAVDPSDPSGNTVYIGAASGGIWKTTNFLVNSSVGPTYVPLTDFGPAFAFNIGGLAVFGSNSDPNQSIIYAATGEGNVGSKGVGILRSTDGGATWTLLDSLTNFDSTGKLLPESQRDHTFVGATAYQVAVDPNRNPNGGITVFVALGGAKGGIYRSVDSGNTWRLVKSGEATSVVFNPESGAASTSNPTGNLQIVYGGFKGDGVYYSPDRGTSWILMPGTAGDPTILDIEASSPNTATPVPVANHPSPNGAKGRIVLGVVSPTGNVAQDILYSTWLYALVATADGHMDGLYLTKDQGQNWTKVALPNLGTSATPSNNTTLPNIDPLGSKNFAQGNYDISLLVDPTNPNIVYVGGTADGNPSGLIRVNTTGLWDPHAFFLSDAGSAGGQSAITAQGPLNLQNWPNSPGPDPDPVNSPVMNLVRDPNGRFSGNTVFVSNTLQFNNQGAGASWIPFDGAVFGTTDQHAAAAIVDPLTHQTRLIFGDDQGVWTVLDQGKGTQFGPGIGNENAVNGSRNGNLQITQFYYGASQPSSAAAQAAHALFYGQAQDDGSPQSDPNILTNGNLVWTGPLGDGTGVATDQTGSGTLYQYNWPCCGGDITAFFQITQPGGRPVGQTFGLIQSSAGPGNTPDPQWPYLGGFKFAVNPVDANGIVISSKAGRVFRTTNQGILWSPIGEPTVLDSSNAQALAFGAPNPNSSSLDDFIYAGTLNGNIFVTPDGGGTWTKISAGLDGSAVQQIVTNPLRGSHDAYAVTARGVYYIADSLASGAQWQSLTGNLFQFRVPFFNDVNQTGSKLVDLTSIAADWRFAIPDDPNNPSGPTHPVLYVAGDGGVFRSKDKGLTWTIFPSVLDGASIDGGYLPNAQVTALSLEAGNINSTTGQPNTPTLANSPWQSILLVTTYGRGEFVINLPDDAGSPIVTNPGPQNNPEGSTPTVAVTATDTDGEVLSYSASNLPSGLAIDTKTGIISGTVGPQDAQTSQGQYNVLVSVSDGQASTGVTFLWTITDPTVPVVTPPPNQTNTEGTSSVSAKITGSDSDNDPLTFNAVNLPPGLTLDSSSGIISGNLATDSGGTYTVTVTASDGVNTSPAKTFTWTVTDPTKPAVTFPNQTTSFTNAEGTSISPVQVQVTDDKGDAHTFSANLPPGLTIDSNGLISGLLGPDAAGIYQVTLTAFDGPLGSVNSSTPVVFTWTVTDPFTPSPYNPGNPNDPEGATVTPITLTANNPSNDPVTFAVTGLPPGLTFNRSTNVISGTLSADSGGIYTVSVTASDGSNTSAPITFTWTVSDGTYPTISSPGSKTNTEGDVVSVYINSSNSANDPFTFTASNLPGNLTIDSNSGHISGTLIRGSAGSFNVTVTAHDGNNIASTTFLWTVNPEPDPVARDDSATTAMNVPVTINVLANDTDPDPGDSLAITGVTNPSNGMVVLNGTGVQYSPSAGFVGTDSFTYSITDTTKHTASATVTVTVTASTGGGGGGGGGGTGAHDVSSYITALYHDVLGRGPDQGGLDSWTRAISSGQITRTQAASGFYQSSEHRSQQVTSYYATFLNRAPGTGEVAIWTDVFMRGANEQQVQFDILNSSEYQRDHPTNDDFVRALYLQVLGRQGDSAGVANWDRQLGGSTLLYSDGSSGHLTRAQVVQAFLTSQESFTRVVDTFYTQYLRRAADPGGESYWVNSLLRGNSSREGVAASILGSDEYFNNHPIF